MIIFKGEVQEFDLDLIGGCHGWCKVPHTMFTIIVCLWEVWTADDRFGISNISSTAVCTSTCRRLMMTILRTKKKKKKQLKLSGWGREQDGRGGERKWVVGRGRGRKCVQEEGMRKKRRRKTHSSLFLAYHKKKNPSEFVFWVSVRRLLRCH